jgi:DNA invertase Pin-like site-specific DNA recombinase
LRESLDLGTASGRLVCHILASIAEFELELRSERQRSFRDALTHLPRLESLPL